MAREAGGGAALGDWLDAGGVAAAAVCAGGAACREGECEADREGAGDLRFVGRSDAGLQRFLGLVA